MKNRTRKNTNRVGRTRAGLLCANGLILVLLCGCSGGGSREPVDTPFTEEGKSTAFKVDTVLAPPSYGSSKRAVPGTYIVKGTYDVTSLDEVQQVGTINLRLAASYDGDKNNPAVLDFEIKKGQPKGSFELTIFVSKVMHPMTSTLDLAYLVGGGVQHSAVKVKPK